MRAKFSRVRALALATLAASAFVTAQAQAVEIKTKIPEGQISIQLYSFNTYINGDVKKLDEVLAELKKVGYSAVEPYGDPQQLYGLSYAQFAEKLAANDLRAVSRHGDMNEASFDKTIADSKALGQEYVGTGGAPGPGFKSYADTLETAKALNRLGKRSVEAGTGKAYFHNHGVEFTTKYDPDGDGPKPSQSAWEIVVENLDSRYAAAQLDMYWAIGAKANVVDLFKRYGAKIEMVHLKDGTGPDYPGENQTAVGKGDIEWDEILAAARPYVRWYHVELDPNASYGDSYVKDGKWREFVADSINSVINRDTPGIRAASTVFAKQASGTVSAAKPVVIKNTGSKDLVIERLSVRRGGDYGSAGEFLISEEDCTDGPVAPNASCTVAVRYAPSGDSGRWPGGPAEPRLRPSGLG